MKLSKCWLTSAAERQNRKHELFTRKGPKRTGLLRFDISDIPPSENITKATLFLHIHKKEGLAGSDYSSVLEVWTCPKIWNWDEVTSTLYDAGKRWDASGGDFGSKIRDLRAKEDMKDRGFSKGNTDANFDFTAYVQQLQANRGSGGASTGG